MRIGKTITTAVLSAALAGGTLAAAPAALAQPAASVAATNYSCGKVWYSGTALTKYGDSGNRVIEVQCLLWFHGYDLARDGKFGDITYSKVLAFQKKAFPNKPAEWDGQVGPKTWAKLRA
ncbi:peptidoglycan-binding domain-containing protein [Streptomyces triticisoli]|uniref:peptidoglycan-binding domain-containing protein n=1 Tax=Streptomyces triticisoli TaxID=2182797 RepID=UPI0013001E5E|nr:peptidoglycan-binding domain-containing protein [Streptomyces triticisoli]